MLDNETRKKHDLGVFELIERTNLQMRARMSPLPVANRPPIGLGATEMTIEEGSLACSSSTDIVKLLELDCTRHLTRVLMSLKHELGNTRLRVPELHTPILGPTEHPSAVGRERDTKDEILVPLERPQTLAALAGRQAAAFAQLPHLDGLVETAADDVAAVGREGDRVDAVLVADVALEPLEQHARLRLPHAHALVQRAGRDEAVVGRDCHGRHAVLDLEEEHLLVGLDVPEPDGAVAAAGGDEAAVSRKVEGVDILSVAGELILDRS